MKLYKIAFWYPYSLSRRCEQCNQGIMKPEKLDSGEYGGLKCTNCGHVVSKEELQSFVKEHPNVKLLEEAMDFVSEVNGTQSRKMYRVWQDMIGDQPVHPNSQTVKNFAQHILHDLEVIAMKRKGVLGQKAAFFIDDIMDRLKIKEILPEEIIKEYL